MSIKVLASSIMIAFACSLTAHAAAETGHLSGAKPLFADASSFHASRHVARIPEHVAYLMLMQRIENIHAHEGERAAIEFIRWHLLISEARAQNFLSTVLESSADVEASGAADTDAGSDERVLRQQYRYTLMTVGSDAAARLHLWLRDIQRGEFGHEGFEPAMLHGEVHEADCHAFQFARVN